jgi:hypothetical protein
MYDVSDIQISNATFGMTISYHRYINIYNGYPESKDTSPVKMQGNFFLRNGNAAM